MNQYLLVYRYISEIAHYESCLPRNEAMNRDENRMDGRMDGYIYFAAGLVQKGLRMLWLCPMFPSCSETFIDVSERATRK